MLNILKAIFGGNAPSIPDFQVRLVAKHPEGIDGGVMEVEIKGRIPVNRTMDTAFVVCLMDITDTDNHYPVISLIDSCQAEETVIFCHSQGLVRIQPNQGFTDWVKVSMVLPAYIQTPYSGLRKIQVRILVFDQNNKPNFRRGVLGIPYPGGHIVCHDTTTFSTNISEVGYKEEKENKQEAQSLTIQVAMGLAFSDGSFDSTESKVIKEWAKRNIDSYPASDQAELKKSFNDAFTESYKKGKNGLIDLSTVTARLSKIGDKKSKFDALELCHAVMGADGEIAATEMQFINKIARELDISSEALNSMKDSVIVNTGNLNNDNASVKVILGIDPSWDEDRIKIHLRKEFQKWNNRLNTLPAGKERDNAQAMLDSIAEARKKYT
jgi:tellurite resistance protein